MTDTIKQIPLADLYPSEGNRRVGGFDQAKLEQLAESIKAVGVQQPAVVRPQPKGKGKFEIVAGERRWRAAKVAGLEALPCVVRELTDVQALEIATVENLQREDIHPLDEADGYARLIERAGYDVDALAAKVGKSASYIYQRLKLRDLIEPARKMLGEGTITAGHAILIARLPEIPQREVLKRVTESHRWDGQVMSVRELGDHIQRNILLDLSAAPFKRDDAILLPEAGACTDCPKRTGFQPLLFADVCKAKRDYCTDPACWQSKLSALVARRRDELAGEPHLVVSTRYTYGKEEQALSKQGVTIRDDWQETRKSEEDAVRCLVVDGDDRGRLTWGKKREKNARGAYKPTAQEKAAVTREHEKQRLVAETRRRLWDAVMAEASKSLAAEIPESLLRSVVLACFDRLWDDAKDALAKAEGWERPEKKPDQFGRPWRDLGPKKIAAMTAPELRLFLYKSSLAGELLVHQGHYGVTKDPLVEAAKSLGVDVAAITAAAKQEAKAKAAPKKARGARR